MRDILFDFLQAQYGFHFHSRHPIYQKGVTLEYSLCFASPTLPQLRIISLMCLSISFLSLYLFISCLSIERVDGLGQEQYLTH